MILYSSSLSLTLSELIGNEIKLVLRRGSREMDPFGWASTESWSQWRRWVAMSASVLWLRCQGNDQPY